MRKVRMTPPSQIMVKTGLSAMHVARTRFADGHLAPPVTATSPEPMMSTCAVPVALALTLPDPAIETLARSARAGGVDPARAGDVIFGALARCRQAR